MMAGAAHDPVFAKKVGIPTKVAKEFNKADDKSGFLGSAMRAKGPAYKEGGKVKKYAEGSQVTAEDEAEYRRSGNYLADKMRLEAANNKAKMDAMMKKIEENRRKAPPARSDRDNPDRGTITRGFARGGDVEEPKRPKGTMRTFDPIDKIKPKKPLPMPDTRNPDVPEEKPLYAKGGSVKGKGCEKRGTRPAKYY
jgi:hypothetical protein